MKNTAPYLAAYTEEFSWIAGMRIIPEPQTRVRRLWAIHRILGQGVLKAVLQKYPDASGVPVYCEWLKDAHYERTQGLGRDNRYGLFLRVERFCYLPTPGQDLAKKEAELAKVIVQGFGCEGSTTQDKRIVVTL